MKLSLLMFILNTALIITWFSVFIFLNVKTTVEIDINDLNPASIAYSNYILDEGLNDVDSTDNPSLVDDNYEYSYEEEEVELEEEEEEQEKEMVEEDHGNTNLFKGEEESSLQQRNTDTHTTSESNPLPTPTKVEWTPDDGISQGEWTDQVCGEIKDSVCHEVLLLKSRKTTFCSAAKVASTTTKQYFYDISSDNELTIPPDAKFGVHEANWSRLSHMKHRGRVHALNSPKWTHVFFWKHVLERFVSGYLDKVVKDCQKDPTDKPHLAIYHYIQYGFSCKEHADLESFVNFLATVPKLEGHFAPQTPLCNYRRFPYTDVIQADENLNESLEKLSAKLGVKHPKEKKKTTKHKTGAKEKLVPIFKDRPDLIQKILNMFQVDCENIPESCDVTDIMAAIEQKNKKTRYRKGI